MYKSPYWASGCVAIAIFLAVTLGCQADGSGFVETPGDTESQPAAPTPAVDATIETEPAARPAPAAPTVTPQSEATTTVDGESVPTEPADEAVATAVAATNDDGGIGAAEAAERDVLTAEFDARIVLASSSAGDADIVIENVGTSADTYLLALAGEGVVPTEVFVEVGETVIVTVSELTADTRLTVTSASSGTELARLDIRVGE